jgi:hypothetical protein
MTESPTVEWIITRHIMLALEVTTAEADGLVPSHMVPVEVRPGVALMHIAALRFAPDNVGAGSAPFGEVALMVLVEPNLAIDMPHPRLALHVVRVLSDSPGFVNHPRRRTLFTPTRLVADLAVDFAEDGMSVALRDARGPIAQLRNAKNNPRFRPRQMWGQHFNDTQDVVHGGAWHWQGSLLEHQRRTGWGRLHEHPLFGGVDTTRVRSCYRGFFAGIDTPVRERFYPVAPQGALT